METVQGDVPPYGVKETLVVNGCKRLCRHQRSQDFCLGGPPGPGRCHPVDATRPMPPSLASVVYTFEALAGSWGSVSAPAVSRIMGGAQSGKKLQNNVGEMTFGGRYF